MLRAGPESLRPLFLQHYDQTSGSVLEQPRLELLFPSISLAEEINKLPAVTATPTDLKGKTRAEILILAATMPGGTQLVVDYSKAPFNEGEPIREAAAIGQIEIDGTIHKPTIIILGDRPEGVPAAEFTEEDIILRKILDEMLGDGDNTKTIGRIAFKRFIGDLFTETNFQLVLDEWNEYIVGHDHTGSVTTPLNSHHLPNVGIKMESEGGHDPIRDRVISFVRETMAGVGGTIDKFFEDERFIRHSAIDKLGHTPMNDHKNRSLALGFAELSNMIRAIMYSIRLGADSQKYPPRIKALKIIDEVTREFQSAEFQQ